MAYVFPCQTPSPAPWLHDPQGPDFFYFIFASDRPVKTRKVQDLAMGLSTEKLATASLTCSSSGSRIIYPPLGKSPPAKAPGKQASLLARLLSAWFLSSPGGCSFPRLTASLISQHSTSCPITFAGESSACPQSFSLPVSAAIWSRDIVPQQHVFHTRVAIPLEAGEIEVPRCCSHSITEAHKYHACPVRNVDKKEL